jgi:hypothetical protein
MLAHIPAFRNSNDFLTPFNSSKEIYFMMKIADITLLCALYSPLLSLFDYNSNRPYVYSRKQMTFGPLSQYRIVAGMHT